jgi:hypothetical protein
MGGDDETIDPDDDPDFISEAGAPASDFVNAPGAVPGGLWGSAPPVYRPKESTPLEEPGGDGAVPAAALWAMKYRRHGHLLSRSEVAIRARYGEGDRTVYVIDDGWKHCTVSRMVGSSDDGCVYVLVARIDMAAYQELHDGASGAEAAFAGADEPCLCAVYEDPGSVSNVSLVESYHAIADVPIDYLPPHGAVEFSEGE